MKRGRGDLTKKHLQSVKWVYNKTKRLSKNQQLIINFLEIKPEMTTRELAELVLGKIVAYHSKEYSSFSRSLRSLERQGYVQRVQVKLKWRIKK